MRQYMSEYDKMMSETKVLYEQFSKDTHSDTSTIYSNLSKIFNIKSIDNTNIEEVIKFVASMMNEVISLKGAIK
jgi:hypothetical protein